MYKYDRYTITWKKVNKSEEKSLWSKQWERCGDDYKLNNVLNKLNKVIKSEGTQSIYEKG